MSSLAIYSGRELIGDGLMKLPVVRAARALFPEHRISWLTTEETVFRTTLKPLVEGLLDEVSVHPALLRDKGDLYRPLPVGGRYEVVIDTQHALWRTLALRRIRHEVFVSSAARFLLSDRRPAWPFRRPKNVVRRLLLLLELAAGRPARFDGIALPVPDELAAKAAALLPEGAAYLGLAPGAGMRVKCWPLERFIAVARWHAARGGVPVFVIGPDERDWLEQIRGAVPEALFPMQARETWGPGFSPLKTIAMARRLSAALANDSGVGHMLAAADIPLLTLFGPTEAEKLRPAVSRGAVLAAQAHGGEAMAAIPTDAVIAQLEGLLAG